MLHAIGHTMWQATDQNAVMDGAAAIEIFLGLRHLLQPAIVYLKKSIRPSSPKTTVAL
jgi:hypothetical protein